MATVNKQAIAAAFGRAAAHYEQHADLQRQSADALLAMLPQRKYTHVLDAGCGPGWMSRRWRERHAQVTALDLSPPMLVQARQKDAAACRGLDHYLDGLSVGLINLANVLFPEVICLGGGISAADDDLLLDPLRERFHRGCFDKDNPPKLVKASLGNDAGVVGAALLCDMV